MSSKLRKLKQQAYEAGRKRDWSAAAEAYAKILELDKNNPSLLNECGDVCLKAGDTTKALRQFLAAAAKYKQNGLLNNAQAVYKKVLRHDPKNLNANWFLAEIRSSQGLLADGVAHALVFLGAAEDVSGEIKEIFLKRCLELFGLYPDSEEVLERVENIFRLRDMPLESARAGCLRAVNVYRTGEKDVARAKIEQIVSATPEITNYAEYTRWREVTGESGTSAPANDFADVNTLDLEGDTPAPADEAAPTEAPAGEAGLPLADTAVEEAAAFEDFLEGDGEPELPGDGSLPDENATDADENAEVELEKDDEGCISIDLDDAGSLDELVEQAATGVETAADEVPDEPARKVNLLDEILAEEGEDLLRSSETEQVSTIASEIGRNLGTDETADPGTQYQQGLVYLEMGLYDQAGLAFKAAAADPAHALQACEMWGIALHREGRLEEALDVLTAALSGDDSGGRAVLGLHYQAGRILEELGRGDEAQEHFRKVHAVDAGFADVAGRLRSPVG